MCLWRGRGHYWGLIGHFERTCIVKLVRNHQWDELVTTLHLETEVTVHTGMHEFIVLKNHTRCKRPCGPTSRQTTGPHPPPHPQATHTQLFNRRRDTWDRRLPAIIRASKEPWRKPFNQSNFSWSSACARRIYKAGQVVSQTSWHTPPCELGGVDLVISVVFWLDYTGDVAWVNFSRCSGTKLTSAWFSDVNRWGLLLWSICLQRLQTCSETSMLNHLSLHCIQSSCLRVSNAL